MIGNEKMLDFARENHVYHPYDLESYLVLGINRFSLRFYLITNQNQ